MLANPFITPKEVATHLSKTTREKRLSLNMTQQSLSEKSGVSLGVLKRFERTGKISLESLLKLAWVLGNLLDFMELYKPISTKNLRSLDDLIEPKPRIRGRK